MTDHIVALTTREARLLYELVFPGFHGNRSHCLIKIIWDAMRNRAIVVARDLRKGTSITNAAEVVHWGARLLCERLGLPTKNILHLEHYPPGKGWPLRHEYNLVRFEESDKPTYGGYGQSVDIQRFLAENPDAYLGVQALCETRYKNPKWYRLKETASPMSDEEIVEVCACV